MGNRKLRREVGRLLKERGLPKAFVGNRKVARSLVDWRQLYEILQFKPGDIVHDCDGFNHIVVGYYHSYNTVNKYFYIDSIKSHDKNIPSIKILGIYQLKFENNCLSCGCSPPMPAVSKEQIEKYFKAYTRHQRESDNGWYDEWLESIEKALNNGESIVDDNGILMEKYKK